MPYIGNQPGTGVRNRFIYTATASQTTFSGADDNGKTLKYADSDFVDVFLNGVCLVPAVDYTSTTKTSVVLTQAASLNDTLEVVAYDIATIADTVSKADGGTFEGNVGFGTAPERQVHIAGNPSILLMEDTGGGTNDKKAQVQVDSGVFEVNSRNDDNSSLKDNIFCADLGTGNIGIGTNLPTKSLHIYHATTNRPALVESGDADALIEFKDSSTSNTPAVGATGDNLIIQTGSSASERARIDGSGNISIGTTSINPSGDGNYGICLDADGHADFSTDESREVLDLNRLADGTLIKFRAQNVNEGSIVVSGTTVSYNGGHLSRWSRLESDNKDTSIVKGTVMTNLDKMVVWSYDAVAATYYKDGDELPEGVSVGDEKTPAKDAYTEDNEQLNCMAVSSVEGDPNVAGVFVNWDHDDDFNDMNVAMTGDMVIRIAQGVTVARGDLLMSAGDGTAKPQGDDIVRSKTIAKVTSTNVSHTYDDSSYLVPCVLMAC